MVLDGLVGSRKYTITNKHLTPSAGKGTLARLNSTATEAKSREQRMADAIRTVLECIGEDPDRQGLLKTPERYAKALLWMTKGYEEKLSGTQEKLLIGPSWNIPYRGHRRSRLCRRPRRNGHCARH